MPNFQPEMKMKESTNDYDTKPYEYSGKLEVKVKLRREWILAKMITTTIQ
jgi:hypothetical protein